MCKISVIVPVYNVENYLSICLDSLLKQSFSDFEVICVNDGSTDNSLTILEEYSSKDNRFRIITQENKGLSGARNTGMEYVNGNYILFLDSDDWIMENTLEEIYNYFKKVDIDILFFDFIYYNHGDDSFSKTSFETLPDEYYGKLVNYNDLGGLLYKLPHNAWSKCYKTDFLKKIDVKFIEGKYYEDLDFHYNIIFKTNNLCFLKKTLYNYRIRNDSITTCGSIKSFDIFEMLTNVEKYIKNANFYNKTKQEFFNFVIINIKYVYKRLNDDLKEDFFKQMKISFNKLSLNQIDNYDKWHFDDMVFCKAILLSENAYEFDLIYEKLYYEFLANHYKGLVELLENENKALKNISFKDYIKKKVDL